MPKHGKQVIGYTIPEKTKWTQNLTDAFVDICVDYFQSIPRLGSPMPKINWDGIAHRFGVQTGCSYTKDAMKNKWDQLKKEWGLWERMAQGETRLGWDPKTRTIDLSDEWWDLKIQENCEFKRFRKNGYRYGLLQPIFKGCQATGERCVPAVTLRSREQVPSPLPLEEIDWFGDNGGYYKPIPVSMTSMGFDKGLEKSTTTSPSKKPHTSPFMTSSFVKALGTSKNRKSSYGSNPTESHTRIARATVARDARGATRDEAAALADSAPSILAQMWKEEILTMDEYVGALLKFENPYFRSVLVTMPPEAWRNFIVGILGGK